MRNGTYAELQRGTHRAPVRRAEGPTEEDLARREALAEAMLARLRGVEPKGAAAIYAGCTLRDFELLCNLNMPVGVRLAGESTSDFPTILGNVFGKRLLDLYRDRRPAYRLLARRIELRDFRPATLVNPGEFPGLEQVGGAGSIQHGYIADGGETISLLSFGRIFGLSRTALVNDDAGVFNAIAELAADAVIFAENALFFSSLLSASGAGPTLRDGVAFFHASHGNLVTGAALSATSLGLAMAALRKQTAPGGAKINLVPRYLLVGPDNEVLARKAVLEISPPSSAPTLEVVVDSHLAGQWFVWADPAVRAGFVHGRLEGSTGPNAVARTSYENEGVDFRVTTDAGVGPGDYRAVVRNPGV